jgi:hypothetical protein
VNLAPLAPPVEGLEERLKESILIVAEKEMRISMKSTCIMAIMGILIAGYALLSLTGCDNGSSSNNSNPDPAEPPFQQASFSNPTQIDNEYLPLNPGTVQVYQKETEDGIETIVVEVLEEAREVAGVT